MLLRGSVLGVLLGVLAPSAADAQGHGWRLSVERLAGGSYSSLSSGTASASRDAELWSVNLFGSNLTSPGVYVASLVFGQTPRLALDYEFASHLTVGLAATLQWSSLEVFNSFGIGIAPRIGYSVRLANRLYFWPRAGVTFSYFTISVPSITTLSSSSDGRRETTMTELTVNLEPTLVYTPIERVGLLLTLLGDIPLIGDVTGNTTYSSAKVVAVGLQFGVQGRF